VAYFLKPGMNITSLCDIEIPEKKQKRRAAPLPGTGLHV
jgi:hypothetical protein